MRIVLSLGRVLMPFLAPLVPAIVGGIASAAGGAVVNKIAQGIGGQQGAGFQAQAAPLQQTTTTAQAQEQQAAAQNSIAQQQALANQLSAQGGIQNQSSVYGQQQALANQLGAMAQGQGPSVARAQLAETTGANVANQAALMAGQRGAGANAGLIARQAAQQGGAIQQQAAGQAATLRAQEQLAAIGALQQQQGMLGNLATTQVGQQTQATQFQTQAQMAEQQQLQANINAQNQAQLQNVAQQNQYNAALAEQNAKQAGGMGAGIASGLGAAVTGLMGGGSKPATAPATTSGLINNPATGGVMTPAGQPVVQGPLQQSGKFAQGGQVGFPAIMKENYKGKSKLGSHLHGFAKGGSAHKKIDALVSPGEKILPPAQAKKVKDGKAHPFDGAKTVPGKPKVDGAVNSYANDTVPKKLAEGSIVLPRSVTKAKDPSAAAHKFIETLKAKKGNKK